MEAGFTAQTRGELKAKLEGLLQSSRAEETNRNNTKLSATSDVANNTITKLPPIRLENGDQSYSIEATKLEFIQDKAFRKLLTSRRRFGIRRYSISCSPELFEAFVDWINKRPLPLQYQAAKYSAQFWIDHAVSAWFLARKLTAVEFEQYALSQFIQNCSLCLFGPWQRVQNEAPRKSSLFLFSRHWIAWNHHLSGGRNSEFTGLKAASLASQVSKYTRDPRIYDLEHWYSACGADLNPGLECSHDTIRRKENQSRIEKQERLQWMDSDEWEQQRWMDIQELSRRK
ncbi:hypothetical protein BT63DRAFT_423811 [Microthyrium microscopicum]|uniref:Uncharacterized protein n=1 Tax=Microthyrium microscopicum TaxID=703497 RepID=A0A6A6UC33_9PEZI|nr:hypothetical protein BT63DRAFT_423811 [Microthyrium microscopicum]